MSTVTMTRKTVADYPNLVSEWHPTKNGDLRPEDVLQGSDKKVWWKCTNNSLHIWDSAVSGRTNPKRQHKCPYCAGKKVHTTNCLATINPKLSIEWHPTKNGELTPGDVVANTHKKVWWICKEGHEYRSSPNKRNNGRGCHLCNRASKSELSIQQILQDKDIAYEMEYTNSKCKHKLLLRFDFAVFYKKSKLTTPIGIIEYHGSQHFYKKFRNTRVELIEQQKRDQIKRDFCAAEGIPLLEITDEDSIESEVTEFLRHLGLIN